MTDDDTRSYDEKKEELKRACIEVDFCDAEFVKIPRKAASSTADHHNEGSFAGDASEADDNSTTDAARKSIVLADAVPEDSKLAALIGTQVKPGRTIVKGKRAKQSSSTQQATSQLAGPSGAAAEGDVDSLHNNSEDKEENFGDDSESSGEAPDTRTTRKKQEATTFTACFLYQPEQLLIANSIMPDPNRAPRVSGSTSNKRKQGEGEKEESAEQHKKRLELELQEVKAELGEGEHESIEADETEQYEDDEQVGGTGNDDAVKLEDEPMEKLKNQKIYIEISDNEDDD